MMFHECFEEITHNLTLLPCCSSSVDAKHVLELSLGVTAATRLLEVKLLLAAQR